MEGGNTPRQPQDAPEGKGTAAGERIMADDPSILLAWYQAVTAVGAILLKMRGGVNQPPPKGWNKPGFTGLTPEQAVAHIAAGGNVGVGMGPGMVAVDADDREASMRLRFASEDSSPTLCTRTPRGFHSLYKTDVEVSQTQNSGIFDIRTGLKGYVMGPGSHRVRASYSGDKAPPDDTGGPWWYTNAGQTFNTETGETRSTVYSVLGIPPKLLDLILPAMEPDLPTAAAPATPAAPAAPLPPAQPGQPTVKQGHRNTQLTSIMGVVVNANLTLDLVRLIGRALNAKYFRLDEQEAARIIENVIAGDQKRHPDRTRHVVLCKARKDSDVDDVADRLDALGIKLRWNDRAVRIEFQEGDGEWQNIEGHDEIIWSRLQSDIVTPPHYMWKKDETGDRHLVACKDSLQHRRVPWGLWTRAAIAIARRHLVDPFLLYLEALPKWDGTPRLAAILQDCFYVPSAYEPIAEIGVTLPCLAAVNRAIHPGAKHDTMTVLIGEEGFGKSTFWETLVGNPDWFFNGLNFANRTREMIEGIHGPVICEAAELVGLRIADNDHLYNFLSTRVDKARMAYGRQVLEQKRRSVIVGTTNKPESLPVMAGGKGRRFIPVMVDKKPRADKSIPSDSKSADHIRATVAATRDQLWAEALHRVRAGEDSRTPEHLEAYLARAVRRHAARDTLLEEVVEEYLAGREGEFVKLLDVAMHAAGYREGAFVDAKADEQARQQARAKADSIQKRVIDQLTNLGWQAARGAKGVRGWKYVGPVAKGDPATPIADAAPGLPSPKTYTPKSCTEPGCTKGYGHAGGHEYAG